MHLRLLLMTLFLATAFPALKAQLAFGGKGGAWVGSSSGTDAAFARTPLFDGFHLPSHVRSNPRGYSPLCRLELRIEDRLPVGVWVKLGEKPLNTTYMRSNAEVRFKVLKF